MNKVTLLPEWREAAERIAEREVSRPGGVYQFGELSKMLDAEHGTQEFGFRWMAASALLLRNYGIAFVLIRGTGYRAATPAEKLKVCSRRQASKMRRAASRQSRILNSVDRRELTDDEKNLHDRHMQRNGFLTAAIEYASRKKTIPAGLLQEARNDRPKLVSVA